MKKLFVFIFLLNSVYIGAQTWMDEKPVPFLPSPQSQLFEKYLNHEISEYNGIPEISIPLYEIEVKGLKIPVTLDYHASGVKYKQFDGDVGAGWSLSIGGYRVCRTIQGLPDEKFTRFSSDIYLEKVALFNQGNSTVRSDINQNFFSRVAGPLPLMNADSEYDQFSYMLPSTSGHFFLEGNFRYPVIYEANKDSINFGGQDTSGFIDMTIIDNAGIKYLLGGSGLIEKSELTIAQYHSMIVNVGWPLKRIETPYQEAIDFQYSSFRKKIYPNDYPISSASVSWGEHACTATQGSDTYLVSEGLRSNLSYTNHMYDGYMFFLNSLTVNNTDTIIITRNGANNYPYAISSIKIKVNGHSLKEISFEYDTPNSLSWHLLLKNIKIGNKNNVFQEYAFTYYPGSTRLPDQYGFYGKFYPPNPDPNMLPIPAYLHQNFVGDLIYHVDTYTNGYVGDGPDVKFYDRGFTDVANYYMLKRITFPTKGYTEYEYDADAWHSRPRVKRITSKTEENANPIVTEYSYENPVDNIMGEHINPYTFFNYFGDEYVSTRNDGGYIYFRKIAQYFPNPILPELSEYTRQYERVTKKQYNINGDTIGKTVSEYNIPQKYHIASFSTKAISPDENMINGFSQYGDYHTKRYRLGYKPTIQSQTFYDNTNQKKKEIKYQYQQRGNNIYTSFKAKQRVVAPSISYDMSQYSHGLYYMETGSDFPVSKKTTTYPDTGGSILEEEYYTYNEHHQLSKIEQKNSLGRVMTKEYIYTWYHHPVWESMNISSTIMKTVTSDVGVIDTIKLETLLVSYPTEFRLLVPDSIVSIINGIPKTILTYDVYNGKRKILQYTGSDGVTVTCLWGYGNKYPVAEIRNATYQNVLNAVGGDTVVDRIANSLILSNGDKLIIDSLRTTLPYAMISTYTYQPGVGILTETDPRGVVTTYEYDTFGRLIKVIQENKMIEKYEYHYKN